MWADVCPSPEKEHGASCGWSKRVRWREGKPEPVKEGSDQVIHRLPYKVVRYF